MIYPIIKLLNYFERSKRSLFIELTFLDKSQIRKDLFQ
jgi:hypothetical protein